MRRVLGQVIVAATLGFGVYQAGVAKEYTQQEIEILTSKAMAGDAEAQFDLGVMYANDEGVRQNKTTAKEWFGKACDNGTQQGCDAYRKLNETGY